MSASSTTPEVRHLRQMLPCQEKPAVSRMRVMIRGDAASPVVRAPPSTPVSPRRTLKNP